MKYGVHRLSWGQHFDPADLGTFFRQAAATGAETVEFRPPDETLNGDWAYAEKVKALAAEHGLELLFCYGYPPGVDMRSPDQYIRQYAAEHLVRAVRAAEKLGGTEVGGVLYSTWPADYAHDMLTPEVRYERQMRSIECLRGVLPVAAECNIRLNLEVLNRNENYIINTVEEGLWFLDQLDSPMAGLVLDVYHMNIEEDDIPAAIRAAGGRIGQFHVSEPNRGIPFHNTRIHWPAIGAALREAGYDGTVTMETVIGFDNEATYNLRSWRNLVEDTSIEGRIAALARGLAFIKQQFGQPPA